MIFEKFALSLAFNLRKQNATGFCKLLNIVSTVAYQIMVAHQFPLPLPRPSLIFSPTKQPYSKVGKKIDVCFFVEIRI